MSSIPLIHSCKYYYIGFRFDTHIMMGLAHGKVKQEAARLALAEEMLQVKIFVNV